MATVAESPVVTSPVAATPTDATRLAVEAWTTYPNQTRLLSRKTLREAGERPDAGLVIAVRPATRHQTMDGFGFALTGGSAELIAGLPAARRSALLNELFSVDGGGAGIGLLRLSIGPSDLSRAVFAYDDAPPGAAGPSPAQFDLDAGDVHVVPVLKEILAVRPDLKLLATPWSAPPWMKTNESFVAGALKPDCYGAYAAYLVAYLAAMRARGITIHAMTPQNEPLNVKNEPSMTMTAAEQAAFVGGHLGPALRAAGFGDVALFCYDHNCDLPAYPLAVLADPQARRFLSGVAWHLYAGTPEALAEVAAVHPDMAMWITEQWVGTDGTFGPDLAWHVRNVLIGAIRNGARAVLEWNLAGDSAHGPHTPRGCGACVGALTIDGPAVAARNVSYYVIAHLARFVPPGSVRISSTALDMLPNVAFATPDGRIVLLVLNDGGAPTRFTLTCDGRTVTDTLPPGAVASYVCPAVPQAA
ncbi:glucosylceramidase [Rhodoplanes elegans]|uniref:Glucosylceramidase n=1 Tax=Rhodoplanes elegans TaxID=29408 RepID=A0A327K1D4_9BRAD|nr:glycoside hydrolase family 30 beta sandwich domain-containing protein [Rhodoplanes elegans]MBK5961553.1 glucosylceramidase [Rhodoplanes elegans]RAI32237.1 glucosylceramidase [Rhodoplanes elegans]